MSSLIVLKDTISDEKYVELSCVLVKKNLMAQNRMTGEA